MGIACRIEQGGYALTLALDIDAQEVLRRTRAAKARRDFAYFVRLVKPEYDVQWFHDVIIGELEQATQHERGGRVGLALPPGHAKSEYAILYCAWMVARDPDIQIAYVTYNLDFAKVQFKRLKDLLGSPRYVHYFGRLINDALAEDVSGEENTKTKIEIVGGSGWVAAAGFGAGLDGLRCDVIVVDDPFKKDEAYSPSIREKRWQTYVGTILQRRRPNRPLHIVMLFTRWHLDDLTGRCKKHEPDQWRWVEIEALRMSELDSQKGAQIDDPREDGEALWEAVATAEELLAYQTLDEGLFWAVQQQTPIPAGGALFKNDWFDERWSAIQALPGTFYQSWDFRHGGKRDAGSFAVGILAFQYDHEPGSLYILSMRRARWSPDETAAHFDALLTDRLWGRASTIIIENAGDGKGILAAFKDRHTGLVSVSPAGVGGKVQRARIAVPYVARGSIVLPIKEIAGDEPWIDAFLTELTLFTDMGSGTGNDDIVDALSQLIDRVYDATDSALDGAGLAREAWKLLMGKGDKDDG